MAVFEGFAIVPPVSPWDEKHRALIEADHARRTIGETPGEAWRIHCRAPVSDPGELSHRIQRWHDLGYRVRRVTLTIHDGDAA